MPEAPSATVTMVYLARLREAFGISCERVSLPAHIATVGALRDWLAARGGPWAVELAPGRGLRIAVNHDLARAEEPIREGDEIALFPPVTGG